VRPTKLAPIALFAREDADALIVRGDGTPAGLSGAAHEVLESVFTIGAATGHADEAGRLVASLRSRLDRVAWAVADRSRPRVAVVEWTDPPFTAGHWVPDLVTAAGGRPVIGRRGRPSVATSWPEIARAEPDLVVIAPCGYRLDAAARLAAGAITADGFPADVPVWAIDADWVVVRPGPRLVDGVEALAGMLHPDAVAGVVGDADRNDPLAARERHRAGRVRPDPLELRRQALVDRVEEREPGSKQQPRPFKLILLGEQRR